MKKPQGVSGAIKKRGGTGSFKELAKHGAMPLGSAAKLAEEHGFQSIALPLIGAGSGGFNQEKAKTIMLDEMQNLESPLEVTVVQFTKR